MQALAAWRERVGAVRRGWEKREAERDELICDFFGGLILDLVMLTLTLKLAFQPNTIKNRMTAFYLSSSLPIHSTKPILINSVAHGDNMGY
jgi:hypothetical protein